VATAPPTIVVKCNEPKLFDESWKRYLLGFLREVSPFQEVPIRMIMRSRSNEDLNKDLPDIQLRNTDELDDESTESTALADVSTATDAAPAGDNVVE
jgi:GTP-binding protein